MSSALFNDEPIVVHSSYLKDRLEKIGILNVKCIDYPSFFKEDEKYENNESDKIIISCLGGTRDDKGLDILIEAFKFLNYESKNRLIFNICGVEQTVKYKDIIEAAKKK